jgi:NAD(P)-dependent dehydrogenase (short-subunit alcohol dehydrogenase family)
MDLEGKVAVVTGGASGIGRAVATRFAEAGMRVVLADIQCDALDATTADLRSEGHTVIGVQTDVSDGRSVDALAAATVAEFGGVHILHNNAGVGVGGSVWVYTEQDWQWVLGVNLWGVIHGVRAFVPIMLEQGERAHVVNTASMAGLISVPFLGAYNVSKHGVVTLSETLFRDLDAAGADIGVSVLCPGLVATNIFESQRNRPDELVDENSVGGLTSLLARAGTGVSADAAVESFGTILTPEQVAADVHDAVVHDRFYVLTHPEPAQALVQARADDILGGRAPSELAFGRGTTS